MTPGLYILGLIGILFVAEVIAALIMYDNELVPDPDKYQ